MKTRNQKIHLVYVRGQTGSDSFLLADVVRKQFMGVPCIKGIYRSSGAAPNWMSGRVVYIPLDKVLVVTEFESFEAYREMLKRHYQEKAR